MGIATNPHRIHGATPLTATTGNGIVPPMHHELANRIEDGIVVRLLWDEANDQVIVRYRDTRTGEAFATRVPNGEALEAFRHPNAYRPDALPVAA